MPHDHDPPPPPTITASEVRARVAGIAAYAAGAAEVPSRDAWAHEAEDTLYRDVLAAIAAGAPAAAELAREALQSREIEFHRWCE